MTVVIIKCWGIFQGTNIRINDEAFIHVNTEEYKYLAIGEKRE